VSQSLRLWLDADCSIVSSREQYSENPSDDAIPLTRDRLVRVPLDELQPDASKQS
jgi:DASH complex subunit DAD2